MKVATFKNNPQIAGKSLLYRGGTNFEIEGLQSIDLEQVKKLNAAGFVQWDSPEYENKILSYAAPSSTVTPPFVPVPAFKNDSIKSASEAGIRKNTISFEEIQTEQPKPQMENNFAPGSIGSFNPEMVSTHPRKIGFLGFTVTDKGGNIPNEARGFNFPAFALNFWWYLFTGQVKTALFTLVPVLGTIVIIQGWFYGHQMIWAANPNKWTSWESYRQSQTMWNIIGTVVLVITFLISAALIALPIITGLRK